MRAIVRTRLVPLAFASAILCTGLATQAHVASAASTSVHAVADGPICPAGTNWDDILGRCV